MSVVYGPSIVHDCGQELQRERLRGRERERLRKRGVGESLLFVSMVLFDTYVVSTVNTFGICRGEVQM